MFTLMLYISIIYRSIHLKWNPRKLVLQHLSGEHILQLTYDFLDLIEIITFYLFPYLYIKHIHLVNFSLMFIWLITNLFIYFSIYLFSSIYLFIYLFIIYLSNYLFTCSNILNY